ncbi:MAG: LUD domain-containing protein [Elusimicrobiales bacterium]|nr:LUD domain-containing protein [Elusimicrobiales bacterium]
MEKHRRTLNSKLLDNAAAALRRNNFEAEVYEDGKAAAAALLELAAGGKTIGVGGSMTVAALGLADALAAAGKTIITHKPGMDFETKRAVWLAAQAADIYLASPQAVTLDGKLIFIDGNGNRGAAVIYGPRKIVLIAGVNKIARDQEEGLWRSRNIAAIANNLRLEKDNPCVAAGRCVDCASKFRICNAVTLLWKKPSVSDIRVLLVNEDLGY